MHRSAELVLITPDGVVLGCLPPIAVSTPWWNHAEAVVEGARQHYGIDITILRLLSGVDDDRGNSRVTYLAETAGCCNAITPWSGALDDHPLRHNFAKCGGPAADLAWADQCLAANGLARTAPAIQVRTWNLSSLWRIPVGDRIFWLKVVPQFFAHEGKILSLLAGGPVPAVLGHEGARMLLADVPGEDLYGGASLQQSLLIISHLIEMQAAFIGREQDLLALGLPDWRVPALAPDMANILERTQAELSAQDYATLRQFCDRLPLIARDLQACGLPPTLIHGDFHPGNVKAAGSSLVLLDWGDSGLSHPLLDQTAFLRHVSDGEIGTVRDHWHDEWRRRIPGSNPERASQIMKPIGALHQAIIRQRMLDNVEPAEHFYNLAKRTTWLVKAAEFYRATDFYYRL